MVGVFFGGCCFVVWLGLGLWGFVLFVGLGFLCGFILFSEFLIAFYGEVPQQYFISQLFKDVSPRAELHFSCIQNNKWKGKSCSFH